MRDQNVRLDPGHNPLGSFTVQISHDPARHVLKIDRALAQIRIVDLAQRFGITVRDFLKNPFDVATFALQPAQHFIDQRPVFDDKKVRIENRGVLGADRFRDFLLHLEDLDARLDERSFETRDLVSNLRALDLITRDVIVIVAHHVNDGMREAGRNTRALQSDFVLSAAHSRAILKENYSS